MFAFENAQWECDKVSKRSTTTTATKNEKMCIEAEVTCWGRAEVKSQRSKRVVIERCEWEWRQSNDDSNDKEAVWRLDRQTNRKMVNRTDGGVKGKKERIERDVHGAHTQKNTESHPVIRVKIRSTSRHVDVSRILFKCKFFTSKIAQHFEISQTNLVLRGWPTFESDAFKKPINDIINR